MALKWWVLVLLGPIISMLFTWSNEEKRVLALVLSLWFEPGNLLKGEKIRWKRRFNIHNAFECSTDLFVRRHDTQYNSTKHNDIMQQCTTLIITKCNILTLQCLTLSLAIRSIMLSVRVVMMSVIMLSVVMLCVVILIVIMLSVIMLFVLMQVSKGLKSLC